MRRIFWTAFGIAWTLLHHPSFAADSTLQLSTSIRSVAAAEPPIISAPTIGGQIPLLPDQALEVRDESGIIPTIDLTTPSDDLWQRMRNGFAMSDMNSPLVADRQAWYLNRPEMLRRVLERSQRYLYHIVDELQKRGMPTELALLPIVESSFNPLAYSPARALGMWQFIPSTGKNYNLQQNWWMDQRRDIIASTNAALDYLQDIYEMHGDWHLALASYNWGEGAVGKAIARNAANGLPTDYLSLRMPDETRYYVPKLQAIKNIVATPHLFGFRLPKIANQPYFGTVPRNRDMDIALAASLAEIPLEEFVALNPAYSRPVMPVSAESPLVLPTGSVQTYLRNLAQHELQEKPLSSWRTHTLKSGEKLDSVAARYGVDGKRLRLLNGITTKTKISPGMALLVPERHADHAPFLGVVLPQTPATPPKSGKKKVSNSGTKSRPVAKTSASKAVPKKYNRPQTPLRKSKPQKGSR